jgi:hypothetical protein
MVAACFSLPTAFRAGVCTPLCRSLDVRMTVGNRRPRYLGTHTHDAYVVDKLPPAIETGDISLLTIGSDLVDGRDGPCNSTVSATKQRIDHCLDHFASARRLHHSSRAGGRVHAVVPMLAGRFEAPGYLARIERLR